MKPVLKIISLLAFFMTIIPSILFLTGKMELDRVKLLMLIATIVWFAATPFWMGQKDS